MDNNNKSIISYWPIVKTLGITKIDEQHHIFMDILNQGMNSISATNSSISKDLIFQLENFIENSFHYEEKLLEQINFPERENHIAQHQAFISKVNQFKLELSYNNCQLDQNIISFMKKWLLSHILDADHQYKKLVTNHLYSSKNRLTYQTSVDEAKHTTSIISAHNFPFSNSSKEQ